MKFIDNNKELEELKYVAISITSFNANKSNIELGSTVSDVVLTWNTNKSPEHQYINNVEIFSATIDENGIVELPNELNGEFELRLYNGEKLYVSNISL